MLIGRKVISHEYLQLLSATDDTFIKADLPMNSQAQFELCSFCGSWVMLQIVSKQKFFLEMTLSQDVPYIKLLFEMHMVRYITLM